MLALLLLLQRMVDADSELARLPLACTWGWGWSAPPASKGCWWTPALRRSCRRRGPFLPGASRVTIRSASTCFHLLLQGARQQVLKFIRLHPLVPLPRELDEEMWLVSKLVGPLQ